MDVYDSHLDLNPPPYTNSTLPQPYSTSSSFSNSVIPAGFAPFNVQNIDGTLFVTYAKQNTQKHTYTGDPGHECRHV